MLSRSLGSPFARKPQGFKKATFWGFSGSAALLLACKAVVLSNLFGNYQSCCTVPNLLVSQSPGGLGGSRRLFSFVCLFVCFVWDATELFAIRSVSGQCSTFTSASFTANPAITHENS